LGEKVGLAFQIKDDIFDFKKSGDIGKPKGIDIKEQKMTLPLIYMLNNMSVLEKRRVINIIKRHHRDPKKVEEVIDLVNSSGGIAYAEAKMNELVKETMDLLSDFPDSVYLESLKKLVNYSISRKR
jgi:octaprenyl-diphosphate synthase